MAAPDPNQAPTVAQFGGPPGGPPPPAPVAPAPASPAQLAEAAGDFGRVIEAMRAGKLPDAATAARVGLFLHSVVKPTAAPASGQPVPAPASANGQSKPVAAKPTIDQQLQQLPLQQLLNHCGYRLAVMMNKVLPGIDLGVTFHLGEEPEIRIATYVIDESGQPQPIAENLAELSALGEAAFATVAQSEQRVEIERPAAVDTAHLQAQNF